MTTKVELLQVVSRQCHTCVESNRDIENCTFWRCSLRPLRPRYKTLRGDLYTSKFRQISIDLMAQDKNIPESMMIELTDNFNGYERHTKKKILKQIKRYCLFCTGGSEKLVLECVSNDCKLYPYRLNKDPSPHPSMIERGKKLHQAWEDAQLKKLDEVEK